ncbi:zinc finger protein 64-like [Pelobates fuscus]|uniref:zinc finger protein 64-like n=1 Tax=Pelobates fuscus TaxID=191477 RepID=UPI002FE4EC0E
MAAVQFPGGTTVLVEISADIHICGLCKQQYNNFDAFVAHKQRGCQLSNAATGATSSVQFVSEDTPPPVSTVNRTITSETQTITVSAPEFVFEHGYQTFLPSDGSEAQGTSAVTIATKCHSRKIPVPRSQRKQSCSYEGCPFKTAYGMKDMERHLRTHTGDKPHKCETCGKCFSRKDKLKTHMRSHTGEKPYKCKECDYCAADSSSLCKHQRIHTNERPFKCQICPYASRNSSQLTVHLRSHTGDAPFQCILCNAKFKINSDLKRHMRVHTGEKPYRCDFCDFFCAMKGNLKSHIKMKHNADTTYKCAECDFQCGSKADLRQHLRSHLPEQPVKCPECTYSCANKAALKVHEIIHSKDRPFKCHFCNFDTKQRSNLTTHIKKCHNEEVKSQKVDLSKREEGLPRPFKPRKSNKVDAKKAFKCDLCDASFVREDSLRSHKKQHNTFILQKPSEISVVQIPTEGPRQANNRQLKVPLRDTEVLPFSDQRVKIMVQGSEKNDVETSPVSCNLIANLSKHVASNQLEMLSQVNLMASPQPMRSPGPTPHTVLPSTPDHNCSTDLHEEIISNGTVDGQDSPDHVTFISSTGMTCTDFEAIIQEDYTEVTVISEDGDTGGESAQSSPVFSSSPQPDASKQNYNLDQSEADSILCPADCIPD